MPGRCGAVSSRAEHAGADDSLTGAPAFRYTIWHPIKEATVRKFYAWHSELLPAADVERVHNPLRFACFNSRGMP